MKTRYSVDPKGPFVRSAVVLLALSAGLRLAWWIRYPEEVRGGVFWVQWALPVTSAVLFIGALLCFGRNAFWTSFFPVLGGVVFFLLKAGSFVWWHRALCTVLYLGVAALYGLAAFGVLPIRRLLIPLFGLPLLFHLLVEDLILMRRVYTLSQWLQEGSVIGIMGALLLVSLGIQTPEEAGPGS